jgi:hypothetical protein
MRLAPLALALLASHAVWAGDSGADPAPAPAPSGPPVLYVDQSWTHIGDGNFSPQSDGSSDLTTESAGPAVEFKVKLTDDQRAAIGDERWRSAVLSGSVIGNDTGQFGATTPTIVELDGREIGRITNSGLFRIAFDKARLLADPRKPLAFRIASGKNSGDDLDDQELGTFRIVLAEEALPKRPVGKRDTEPQTDETDE